jgi:predicted AlkP superfamily pyrophosphatase or phosphodiesterase
LLETLSPDPFMTNHRFVILVLDGLRPDLVTPERMPNLSAFRDDGAVLDGCRAQFPSQTRVNKVSFATGTTPGHHGIHFNKIYVPELSAAPLDLGSFEDVRGTYDVGELITAPTIGRVLADGGKRFALVHCGFPGAPWLLNYRGNEIGQEHLSLAGFQYSTPALAKAVEERHGTMPAPGGVDLGRTRFGLKAFMETVYPSLEPDVSLIWSDEPDKSEHVDGLRGPLTETALRHCDEMVGDLVAWWRQRADRDHLNLLIVSDHGHVEISQRAAVGRLMMEAGLPVTLDADGPGGFLLPFGGLYQRDLTDEAFASIVTWMQSQPWCGNLFTGDRDGTAGIVPGTFSKALVSIDHKRAPELVFSLRRFDADANRPLGHAIDTGSGEPAGSTHGGMHWTELRNCFFAQGPDFRQKTLSGTIGGLIDLVPTMAHVLGLAPGEKMSGRALTSLLAAEATSETAVGSWETVSVENAGYAQHVRIARLPKRTVVDHGWRD